MTNTPTWEAPPADGRGAVGSYDWPALAARMRSNPGKWLKIFDRDRVGIAESARSGANTVVNPKVGFEVRTRNNERVTEEDGIQRRYCSLYVRYVPELDPNHTPPRKRAAKKASKR